MSSSIKKTLIALSISSALAAPSAFATNGYFAHGYSTTEKSLAGAGVAYSQDAMAIANNPAGIAGMGERLDVGAALFNPNRSFTTTGGSSATDGCSPQGCNFRIGPNSVESDSNLFFIPHIAYNWQLDSNTSFAVAAYGNGGMNTTYKKGTATLPVNPTGAPGNTHQTFGGVFGGSSAGVGDATGVNLAQLFINASYAKKINKDHALGASLIFAYQEFKADGLGAFAAQSSDPANLSNNGDDSSTGFGVKLGWQGKVAPDVTIGVSYQSKISMSEFDDYAGLFAEGGDFDIPASSSIGLAWKTSDRSTLVVDVQSIYYSDIAAISNPIANIFTCAPGAPTVGGTGDGCLGGSNGAGFGWDDMTVVKVGYEWEQNDMTWRVGLSNGSQPIADSETMFNILAPAVIETHITGGFTMPIDSASEFTFAAMYAPSNSVSGTSPFDGQQTIEIEMDQLEFQGTYTMKF